MYAVVKENKFTGVVYESITKDITNHHRKYNEICLLVDHAPVNTEFQNEPENFGAPSAQQLRFHFQNNIDNVAGEIRAAYAASGSLIGEEYTLTLKQAGEWDGTGNAPATVACWATASGMSEVEAKQSIIDTATAWNTVLEQVREQRLIGKATIANAADDADFEQIAKPFIEALEAIAQAA